MTNTARKREIPFPIAHDAFHALVDVTKSLLRPMNLNAVLDQILTQVERLFGYEICSVILPTGRDNRLYMAAHRGYDPEIANSIRIKIGEEGIIGHVAEIGRASCRERVENAVVGVRLRKKSIRRIHSERVYKPVMMLDPLA